VAFGTIVNRNQAKQISHEINKKKKKEKKKKKTSDHPTRELGEVFLPETKGRGADMATHGIRNQILNK